MGEYNDEFDNLTQDDHNDSDLVKQLRKQLREATKAKADLEKEVGSFRAEKRSTTIADVLKAKGVNPKVAKLIPTDLEPSDEAVAGWLEEWGDVFGVVQPEKGAEAPGNGSESGGTGAGVDPADRAAFQAAQRTETGGGVNPLIGDEKARQVFAKARSLPADEAYELLRSEGFAS